MHGLDLDARIFLPPVDTAQAQTKALQSTCSSMVSNKADHMQEELLEGIKQA